MSPLSESVLPLIRTRADLHRWSAANAHGGQMHEAIDLLEAAIPTTDPKDVHTTTHKALASSVKVIAGADDSSGIIGDACRRLLKLHPQTAAAANASASKLVDWMMQFQFDGDVDYFELDPVAYAPALGDAGMTAYRERLDAVRADLGPQPANADRYALPDRHERWVLEWNDRRLAVLDHDVDAIIRTHARDRRVAAWLQDAAEAFEEIGEITLAIDWARQAIDTGPQHQSLQAADYWCQLLHEHHPDEELPARLLIFRRWPSSTTAAHLHQAAGQTWPNYREEVAATLTANPRDAVLFTLLTLHDPARAWQLAHELNLSDDDVWSRLATDYESIDPIATLPVHERLVDQQLVHADAKHYRYAARRLATMRKLAAGTDQASHVETLIADLRDKHRRRPRLQKEFDRANLP